MTVTIKWDRPKLKRLKKAQAAAIEQGQEVYVFEGNELLVAYAKYLIQHLESQFQDPSVQ